jgi:hypothetical protein
VDNTESKESAEAEDKTTLQSKDEKAAKLKAKMEKETNNNVDQR